MWHTGISSQISSLKCFAILTFNRLFTQGWGFLVYILTLHVKILEGNFKMTFLKSKPPPVLNNLFVKDDFN